MKANVFRLFTIFLIAPVTLFLMLNKSSRLLPQSPVVSKPVDPSSINPGRYDTTCWNRAPYRLVQTNLRKIDVTMGVGAYVQSMVYASANIVLINVGGIVANYPTQLPYHFKNTNMKGDLAGDLIKSLYSKGIKMIDRFDFSKINETLAFYIIIQTMGRDSSGNQALYLALKSWQMRIESKVVSLNFYILLA